MKTDPTIVPYGKGYLIIDVANSILAYSGEDQDDIALIENITAVFSELVTGKREGDQ